MRERRVFAVMSILLVLALITISTVSDSDRRMASINSLIGTPSIPVPSDFFGMHLMSHASWPSVRVGALGKGTITAWPYIERSKGSYVWSNLDAWVAAAELHGVDIFYSFNYVPKWASSNQQRCVPIYLPGIYNCPAMPNRIEDFDEFVRALTTRYRGKIKYYELWNEPETAKYISIPEMVKLTTHAYNIIRAVDPRAKIISPSFYADYADYMDKYFALGGIRDVDIISLHAYTDPTNCRTCLANAPENLTPSGPLLQPLFQLLAKYDLQRKPLWDTEGSWGNIKTGALRDPDQRTAFVARYILLHWSSGVTRFYWYAWDEDAWGTLWTDNGGPTGAANAYTEVQKWMTGAVMNEPCEMRESVSNIWTCGFSRSNGYRAIAVWTPYPQRNSRFTVAPLYRQYRDLNGRVSKIIGTSLEIGAKPVLVETHTVF